MRNAGESTQNTHTYTSTHSYSFVQLKTSTQGRRTKKCKKKKILKIIKTEGLNYNILHQ